MARGIEATFACRRFLTCAVPRMKELLLTLLHQGGHLLTERDILERARPVSADQADGSKEYEQCGQHD